MKILGLDLGTTSVGWALVNWDEAKLEGAVAGMGARIFPEGVIQDKSSSYPPNQIRRQKRLARRTLRRRKLRRRLLGDLLREMGLLPDFSKDAASAWATAMRMDKENGPYALRARGLKEKLEPYALGRALYHLGKRRGFRGRDQVESEGTAEAKKEEGQINDAIAGLRAEMNGAKLGEHLASLPEGTRKRGRHTHRDMHEEELDALWDAQARHYPDILTPERKAAVRAAIFNQRPVFWRLNTLGRCRFCPGADMAPAGAWATQQFVMLEQITKLRISGGNARPLDAEERAIVTRLAETQATVSFGAIRTALKPLWRARGEEEKQPFNLEASEKGIKGNALEAKLANIFGPEWGTHPARQRIRDGIHGRIFSADYVQLGKRRIEIRRAREQDAARKEAAARMIEDWDIPAEQAEALSKLTLPSGWNRLSVDAIAKMLPEMARGTGVGELTMSPDYEDWRRENFPDMERPTGELLDKLPSNPKEMPDLRNPTVNRTLNEVRKVVNNIIRVHGKPDLIRIELTRELRQPKKRREDTDKKNRDRERARKAAAADLERNGIPSESPRNIEKYLLWKECQELCPYTGRKIGFDDLFRLGLYDVEHIFPRARSLDNGFANKTLCQAEFNRNVKGDKTPFEIFGHDEDALHQLKTRMKACFGSLDHPKSRRFLARSFAEAGTPEFEERQLRDTAYAAVAVRDFLKKLYPDTGIVKEVQTCNGAITAQLRDAWGLNVILSEDNRKNRADHRHHAIDALAVALTTPKFVKRLSDWNREWRKGLRPPLALPWNSLKEDAGKAVNAIVVSHKVRKKVSGGLHAETYYGDTGIDEKTGAVTYRHYATKKPVAALSKGELAGSIRDPRVSEILNAHVAERGGDPKKAFPPYPRLPNGPEIRKVRITVKQQQRLMEKNPAGHVIPSGNHHMAIYREADGSVSYEVVSLFEASRRLAKQESVIRRNSAAGGGLIMSLAPGDTLKFPPEAENGAPAYRIVTGVWADGRAILEDHIEASGIVWSRPNVNSLHRQAAVKVSVDPIGRVSPAHD